jgi:hypothetical protein
MSLGTNFIGQGHFVHAGDICMPKLLMDKRAWSKCTRLFDPATWFSLSEAYFEKSEVSPHARDIFLASGDILEDPGDNILKHFFLCPYLNVPRDIFVFLFRAVKNGLKCYIR